MVAPAKSIHAQRPLQWLLDQGCRVTLLDSLNPYPAGRKNFRFIPDLRIRGKRYHQKLLGQKLSHKLSQFLLAQELRWCRRFLKPDITHIHWADHERGYACWQAGLRPIILTVWGSDINKFMESEANPEHRLKVGELLAGVDLTLVDTPEMAEKCCGLAGRRIPMRLLPLGIDTDLFRPFPAEVSQEWRRRLTIPANAKVLLSIRAFGPNYGQDMILEAFARAFQHFKQDAILVFKLYNKPTPDSTSDFESAMRHRVQELGLGQAVRWLDEVEYAQIPELYAMADVIINYPLVDAFPVTFLEAAACERPVISVRLPAYAGTFAEQHFRMVEPENIESLAAAMVRLVNEPSERGSLLAAARRVITKEFSEALTVKRLLATYQEISAATSPPREPA